MMFPRARIRHLGRRTPHGGHMWVCDLYASDGRRALSKVCRTWADAVDYADDTLRRFR